jgi:bifunctional polynucleotide phosphatase/kinase
MFFTINKPRFRSKLAIFDFDWTLVKPKNGNTFPKYVDDCTWLNPNVSEVIKSYYKKGYGIYIITNQSKKWKQDQITNVMTLVGYSYNNMHCIRERAL